MRAKKSLGQHFLKSKPALIVIRDASEPTPDDIILEIGPGEGTLTEILLGFATKVIVVEKDDRLIPVLEEKFKKEIQLGKLEILHKDILESDTNLLSFYDHPYKVVANIPYYITGQILRMFLEAKVQPELMVLLIQKEVAERIVAKDRKESLLSISVKAYGEPKIIKNVPRGAFTPQPNVDSAILLIENISKNKFKEIDRDLFWKLVHAGFKHKRKQLFANLVKKFPEEKVSIALKELGINPKIRAEDLRLHDWLSLCRIIV